MSELQKLSHRIRELLGKHMPELFEGSGLGIVIVLTDEHSVRVSSEQELDLTVDILEQAWRNAERDRDREQAKLN